jgi:hypothetical protein
VCVCVCVCAGRFYKLLNPAKYERTVEAQKQGFGMKRMKLGDSIEDATADANS